MSFGKKFYMLDEKEYNEFKNKSSHLSSSEKSTSPVKVVVEEKINPLEGIYEQKAKEGLKDLKDIEKNNNLDLFQKIEAHSQRMQRYIGDVDKVLSQNKTVDEDDIPLSKLFNLKEGTREYGEDMFHPKEKSSSKKDFIKTLKDNGIKLSSTGLLHDGYKNYSKSESDSLIDDALAKPHSKLKSSSVLWNKFQTRLNRKQIDFPRKTQTGKGVYSKINRLHGKWITI